MILHDDPVISLDIGSGRTYRIAVTAALKIGRGRKSTSSENQSDVIAHWCQLGHIDMIPLPVCPHVHHSDDDAF